MDEKSASLVDAAGEALTVFRAADAVLRREEPHELNTGRARLRAAQPLDVRLAMLVDPRLVGEQSDLAAADEVNAVREQDTDPRAHPRGPGLTRAAHRTRANAEQQQGPLHDAPRASRSRVFRPSLHASDLPK